MASVKVVEVGIRIGIAVRRNVKKEDLKRLERLGLKPGTIEREPGVEIKFRRADGMTGSVLVSPDYSNSEVSQAIREKLEFLERMRKNVWEEAPMSSLYLPKKTVERWKKLKEKELEV